MSASDSRIGDRLSLIAICIGGQLMVVSMFFRFAYGPMGVTISYYAILSHNVSWQSSAMLIPLWPLAFGLLEAAFAALFLTSIGRARQRYHWLALAAFIGFVAFLHLGALLWHAGIAGFQRSEARITWVTSIAALVALILVAAIRQTPQRRSAEVRLVGTAWAIIGLYPVSDWTPIESVLWAYGLGYWLLLGGTLLIAVASIRQLYFTRFPGLSVDAS